MTRKTASMETMEELHNQTAKVLQALISPQKKYIPAVRDENGEIVEEAREEWEMPSPAALAVARAFLKDNSVFATDGQSAAVGELKQSLAARAKGRKPTAQDMNDALAQVSRELLQ